MVCSSRRAVTGCRPGLFHQRAGGQDGGLVQLFDGHAVVQVLQGFGQDGVGIDVLFQAGAGGVDQARTPACPAAALAVVQHVQLRCGSCAEAPALPSRAALFHVLGAVQHVGTGHVVLARTHQRQFDLVLHVFDMEVPPGWRRTSAATTLSVSCSTSSRMRAEAAPWPPLTARKALVMAMAIFEGSNATTAPLRRMMR
jgi:hypothetical protein